MPLYREWASDPYSLAAIWEIGEPESFFLEKTGLETGIRNEKRRLEHLAGRFLLRYLKQDFPLLHIRPDGHDKPRIDGNRYYFSISHSFPYVAAVVSPWVECGIDIQVWHQRMLQLQNKFLSGTEQELFENDPRKLTLAWSAKEAAYKWQGRRGVEFIDHLPIQKFEPTSNVFELEIALQLTHPRLNIKAEGFLEQEFACALIVHSEIIHPGFH